MSETTQLMTEIHAVTGSTCRLNRYSDRWEAYVGHTSFAPSGLTGTGDAPDEALVMLINGLLDLACQDAAAQHDECERINGIVDQLSELADKSAAVTT